MTAPDPTYWFLILVTFGSLAIAAFLIRTYALRYNDVKAKMHAIRNFIVVLDESIQDDTITKDEFKAIIKRILEILTGIK